MSNTNDTTASTKKTFARNVGKLATGTIIAQAVGLLAYPIITRLFDTATYGVFSIFLSISSVIYQIACFRYEQAILIPKDDKDAGALLFACIIITTVISAILVPIFIIFGDAIATLLNAPDISKWLIIVPLAVFIDGLYLALRYWNTRRARFGAQAITQGIQSVSGSGLKTGFGFAGWLNAGALIFGQLIGQGIGLAILFIQALKYDLKILHSSFSISNIKKQMIRYKKFPLIDTWSMLFHNLSWQLPVFMLTGFFSEAIAGLYSLGYLIIQTPLSLIGGSISQVFLQRASEARRDGTIGLLVEDVVEMMFFLSLVPLLILMVLGGDIFAFVFGEAWFEAGVYVQILSVWAILWFISNPIGNATSILEIQEYRFRYTIANLVTRFAALAIGGYFQSVYLAMFLFAVFGMFTYGYLFYAIFTHAKASFKNVLYECRRTLIFGVLFVAVIGILMYVVELNFFIVLAITAVLTIAYYLVLCKINKKVREYLPF